MLYQNKHGYIEYSSRTCRYTVEIKGETHSLLFCEFLNMYSKIKSIDIEEVLYNTYDEDDYNTFQFLKSEKTIVLNLHELLVVKDLMEGIIFELYLEDVLYRAGVYLPEKELVF